MHISTRQITSKKVRRNSVNFSTSKITLIKVHEKIMDFSTIEITSKKIHGNNVDFSTIEITSKTYTEMTWSSRYRRNIQSNRRRFDVVYQLGNNQTHNQTITTWPTKTTTSTWVSLVAQNFCSYNWDMANSWVFTFKRERNNPTSFSSTFCLWFSKKDISHVMFFHCLVAFTFWDI